MNASFIFDFKLAVPIVIDSGVDKPIEKVATELGVEYETLVDVLHSRKAVRFFESNDSVRGVVKFGLGNRKVVSFNSFEIVNISEYYSDQTENKKSKILHGSKAIQCLAFLSHVDICVLDRIQVPLSIHNNSNHRQWVDISKLVADVMGRNNRLGLMIECSAPDIILVNEERILQEYVTYLECNNSLVRDDGTTIRSLNDLGYSLIDKWIDTDPEDDSEPECTIDEDDESGEIE